ncbi:hypothetical protein EY643_03140 [Halioglobus maricola]|uniref:Heme-binding protein n=1 Tax=Halioglobus maricola TaxID=2601894 RepID=A0A5P9NFZ5_9GAMM|nr:hypothetical protein [Halioglobus maricola]QFU74727.1 hypothetical protein EY643_03140 [Halioglobus maricola]
MKIRTIAVAVTFAAGLSPLGAMAQDKAPAVVPVELFACTFKEDKGWKDLDSVNKRFAKWSKKNDGSYSAWTISPQFRQNDGEFDVGWIGSWATGAEMGKGMDNWMSGNDGIGEDFGDVIDCSHSLVSSVPVHAPKGPPKSDGIVWFSSCTLEEGSDSRKAFEAHKKFSSMMADMGGKGQAWLMYPVFGFSDIKFDYYSVVSFDNYGELGEAWHNYTNGGGYAKHQQTMAGVASCDSPRVYDAKVVVLGSD